MLYSEICQIQYALGEKFMSEYRRQGAKFHWAKKQRRWSICK